MKHPVPAVALLNGLIKSKENCSHTILDSYKRVVFFFLNPSFSPKTFNSPKLSAGVVLNNFIMQDKVLLLYPTDTEKKMQHPGFSLVSLLQLTSD